MKILRFIPTPVGNGGHPTPPVAAYTVHPHACGERSWKCGPSINARGSSPRLWGTALPQYEELLSKRFIPTPVGNGGCQL